MKSSQSNLAEFQAQLNKMAGIYRNAVATIVAAAGFDVDYGLSGAESRPRTKHSWTRIGEYTLGSSMSDPRNLVRESV